MALQFGSGNRFHCDYEYDGSICSWFADVEAFNDQDDDVFVVARQPYNFMGIAVDEKRNIGGFLLSFSGVDLRRDGISSRWIKFVIFTKEFPPINFEFRRFLGEECYYGGWSIAKEDEETVAFDGFARLNISEKDYEYDYNLTKVPIRKIVQTVYGVSDENWVEVNKMEAENLCNLGTLNIDSDQFTKAKKFFVEDSKNRQFTK